MKPVFFLFLFVTTISFSQTGTLKLWYNQPSGTVWENALPVGNGFLGAMVYGNVATETIQLNENTVWSGGPNRNDNPMAMESLEEIRKLIFSGKNKQAEQLANNAVMSKKSHGQMFQPVGDFHLAFKEHETYTDYTRELDLETAIARTSYTVNGITYNRQVVASLSDRVIVIHLTASRPGSLSFTAFFNAALPGAARATKGTNLAITGTTPGHEGVKGSVRYRGIARVRISGGLLARTDTSLVVTTADAATIYISIGTNFNDYHNLSGNEEERAERYLAKAASKSFDATAKAHIAVYQKYFNRVKLDLGSTEAVTLPTDERLKNFAATNDPQLVTVYYQFGRYLLISSSQPGGQPATLQGIWNRATKPPWDSKYTININTEMNYWPAEKTSLPEMHQPLMEMVKDLSVTGRKTAGDMYGARGWVAHHNTDLWRATGAVDGAFYGAWVNGGGWLSQHIWEHYLYSGNKKFLAAVYPVLKGAALFYADVLTEHPKYQWLVVVPDQSPENGSKAFGGSSLDAGVTMTNQIIFDVFSNVIQAAGILKTDRLFADSLKLKRSRLPPMQIGKHGQLQEWLDDVDDPQDNHRHISHLYGLFPSNQISAYRTPDLYSAAKNTLLQRGDVSTGWSMGWKVNWWAKMMDGNHAYQLIKNQLTPVGTLNGGGGTYNNLFDAHPPFQIDGNFGCTSGITEMLMQSADGTLHLLPALPDAWRQKGSIAGLRARGGFQLISMEWKDGRVVKAVIGSTLGGNLRLRVPNRLKLEGGGSMKIADGDNANPFYAVEKGAVPIISPKATITPPSLRETTVYDIPTKPGQTFHFVLQEF